MIKKSDVMPALRSLNNLMIPPVTITGKMKRDPLFHWHFSGHPTVWSSEKAEENASALPNVF